MRYLFAHYNDTDPESLRQNDLSTYLVHIKSEHGVGRDKCRMVASACSVFFKYIRPSPFVIPNALYPRKTFHLPNIMSQEEVWRLIQSCSSLKSKAMISLFYASGLRLSELRYLKMSDLESKHLRLKVVCGKGNKDRYTLLPQTLIEQLRTYYKAYRPKVYLFEGQSSGQPMNDRSIQWVVRGAMKEAGLNEQTYTARTLRHSFATHLLDAGNDIHTIKELLGHSKIETTMIYLHLQTKKRQRIVSPFDALPCPL